MKTAAVSARPPVAPASTLKYRPKWTSLLYALLVAIMLGAGAQARFHLPQTPFIDSDVWGYFNPAFSWMTVHGFQHTYDRNFLYPAFLLVVFELGNGFKAVCVAQHLLGLLTGLAMLAAWWRVCRLFRCGGERTNRLWLFLGLLPTSAYLTSITSVRYEHAIRPEAIFPSFVVLSIWLNLEFIQRRWIERQDTGAVLLGAAGMVVSLICYQLKPAFGFGLLFANLPLAASLVARGMPPWKKAAMAGGGAAVCGVALLLPESILSRSDPYRGVFLPDTLMTVHADQIRDQIAEDLAAHRPTPFPEDQVRALLGRLDTTLALARLPENHPYPSLGFNPDYLLYINGVYDGVTDQPSPDYNRRIALGYYFYRQAFVHHPWRMLRKIGRQLLTFYHFGSTDRSPFSGKGHRLRGAEASAAKEYAGSAAVCVSLDANNHLARVPTLVPFMAACEQLSHEKLLMEQGRFMYTVQRVLEALYLPALLLSLAFMAWSFWKRRPAGRKLVPAAVTLLLFSYNLGDNLTVAVVHSLDIGRYIAGQLAFTFLASGVGTLFLLEMVRRLAMDAFVARAVNTTAPVTL